MDRRIVFISLVGHLFKHLSMVEVEDHLEACVCSASSGSLCMLCINFTNEQVEGMDHN